MSNAQFRVPGRIVRSSVGVVLASVLIGLAVVAPVLAVAGPTKLSDPAVSPREALVGQSVTFSVTYRNREGSPPGAVEVIVGGARHVMAPAPGDEAWKTGVRFTFVTTLPVGSHGVAFSGMSRDRFVDEIDGGSVVVSAPPAPPPPSASPSPRPPPPPPASSPTPVPQPAATPKPSLVAPATPPSAPPSSGPPIDSASPPDDLSPDAQTPASPEPDRPITAGGGPTDPRPQGDPDTPSRGGPGTDRPDANGSWGGVTEGGWGALARTLEALGIDAGRGRLLEILPTVVSTAGGVTLLMAFMFFGKKRRDGEPPAPDEVLQAGAARGTELPAASELVPQAAPGAPRSPMDAEMAMPRWRRPSLLEARKTDPLRDPSAPRPRLSFEHGLVGPVEGAERRLIRYNVVRLTDAPDELRAGEIGFLDQGDEVQLLERSGSYWLVLCPDGRRGWLHKMTLGDTVGAAPSPGPRETWGTTTDDPEPEVDDDVLAAFLAARGRA